MYHPLSLPPAAPTPAAPDKKKFMVFLSLCSRGNTVKASDGRGVMSDTKTVMSDAKTVISDSNTVVSDV